MNENVTTKIFEPFVVWKYCGEVRNDIGLIRTLRKRKAFKWVFVIKNLSSDMGYKMEEVMGASTSGFARASNYVAPGSRHQPYNK